MDKSEPLLDATYRLLEEVWNEPELTSADIANAVGDGQVIGVHWIRKFKIRRFDNPGVCTVQALHDYLRALPRRGRAARVLADAARNREAAEAVE